MSDFEPTDYQLPGYSRLIKQKKHGLGWEMGLGKTAMGVRALYEVLNSTNKPQTVLILCPKNALRVWEDHIKEWFAGLDLKYGKTTPYVIHRWRKRYNNITARKKLWSNFDSSMYNIYITTYKGYIQDKEVLNHHFKVLILDEAKRIRNRKTANFKEIKKVGIEAEYFWPLTGTPGRLPEHFWTMFHIMDHKYFSSFWKFVNTFMFTQKLPWGGLEILGFKNETAWKHLRDSKFTILSNKEVGHEPTRRNKLWAELDEDQERVYRDIEKDMLAFVGDNLIITPTTLARIVRYRQLLVCPKILDPSLSIGGAFKTWVEMLKDEEIDHHNVVFTPFTDAIPHFKDYLYQNGFLNVFILQGGINPDDQVDIITKWRKTKGIMICSIKYAEAFSLEPATCCYFFGKEFDPEENAQAEARLNRMTTNYVVNSYYWNYEDTYDIEQSLILDHKHNQMTITLR